MYNKKSKLIKKIELIIKDNVLKKRIGDKTEFTVPSGVTEIWEGVYKGCPNLTTIALLDFIKRVAISAFKMGFFDENRMQH